MREIEIDAEAIQQMRERGGKWACYVNAAMDSANRGHVQFLQYGEGRTFKEPPKNMPDTAHGLGWRYPFAGYVDLKAGKVVEKEPTE